MDFSILLWGGNLKLKSYRNIVRQADAALIPYDERTYELLFKRKGIEKLSKSCDITLKKLEGYYDPKIDPETERWVFFDIKKGEKIPENKDIITRINESVSCSFFSNKEYKNEKFNPKNMEIFIPAISEMNVFTKKNGETIANESFELTVYYLYHSDKPRVGKSGKPRFSVKPIENPIWKLCGLEEEKKDSCPEWVLYHGCLGMLNSGIIPIKEFEEFL